MEEKDYFDLCKKATIFQKLSERPDWWKKVLKDNELYVNVRKDNRIHVYYKGAAVIGELKYNKKKGFTCQIHKKYLGKSESSDYCSSSPENIMNDIDNIKKQIDCHYYQKNNYKQRGENKGEKKTPPPEGASEKEIQGDYYTGNKYGGFIDTEFAFNYSVNDKDRLDDKGKPRQIRIDFVTINEDGLIEFVELKCISDPRLSKKEDSGVPPEIVDQMKKYNDFINDKKNDIIPYYKKVQCIMKTIGVENPLADREIKGIAPKARLIFAPYKDGKENHPKRKEHVKGIESLLKSNKITSNIDELLSMIKE